MLKVRSNDKVLQKLLLELVDLLTSSGSFFNPGLQLEVRKTEFSFSARKRFSSDELLVSLPMRCMPVLSDFRWALDANRQLCWTPVSSPEAKDHLLHKQIVGLLVGLYNYVGKLDEFARNYPVVQLAKHKPFLQRLLKLAHAYRSLEQLELGIDQFIIHCYWYSRVFSDSLNERQLLMLPVMGFFDHCLFSSSFIWKGMYADSRELSLSYLPVESRKGVFARYEIMDNLHAFVDYGFVDDKAFFVQSQPFTIVLGEGVSLEVGYQSVSANKSLAEDWLPLPRYDNSLMYRALLKFLPDRVFMPYMLVPLPRHLPAFEEALIAQLREIETKKGVPKGSFANAHVVNRICKTILSENERAYLSLGQAAKEAQMDEKASSTRLLKKMLNHQLRILKEFRAAIA